MEAKARAKSGNYVRSVVPLHGRFPSHEKNRAREILPVFTPRGIMQS